MPSIPGLNTRETALLFWMSVALVWGLATPNVRNSMVAVCKALFGSALLVGVLLVALIYTAVGILLLWLLGYWEIGMVKEAVLWFLGSGVVALFNTKDVTPNFFRSLVVHSVGIIAIVEFIVNLYTFALWIELILVPVIALLVGTQAVAELRPEYTSVKTLLTGCLALLGVVFLSFSIFETAVHFGEVDKIEQIKELLLPLLLMAWFVPYLYLVRLFAVMQSMLVMIHFKLRQNESLYRFACRSIVLACGISLRRAHFLADNFQGQFWGVTDEADVLRIIARFNAAWQTGQRGSVGS